MTGGPSPYALKEVGKGRERLVMFDASARMFATTAVLGLLLVRDCGGDGSTQQSAAAGFPMTFENCGQEVTIENPPERVVLLQDGAVPLLDVVDALDNSEHRRQA
jgi:ABC-type Fe3+-hydroxamate transport system substrate-binding protein